MSVWDFLATPAGQDVVHGVILLLNVLVLGVTARTTKRSTRIERRLDVYVRQLMEQIHGGHEHV